MLRPRRRNFPALPLVLAVGLTVLTLLPPDASQEVAAQALPSGTPRPSVATFNAESALPHEAERSFTRSDGLVARVRPLRTVRLAHGREALAQRVVLGFRNQVTSAERVQTLVAFPPRDPSPTSTPVHSW